MAQNVLITGTGRKEALGYNLVLRYLEQGDTVFATVRQPSEALEQLKSRYPDKLYLVLMDISSTESVNRAAVLVRSIAGYLDLVINNAVTVSPDYDKEFAEANLDYIAGVVDVDAVGPLRVTKALLPLLKKSAAGLVVNISSESGSIGACYRTNTFDYSMAKAALNMGTMLLRNAFKEIPNLNIICIHPGWMRTNEGNALAPLIPYDHAETLRLLFEKKRRDKDGDVFVTYEGIPYPW